MAGEQSSVGMQQRPKALEHAPLRRAIEIDHRVSAEDRVERAANRPYGGHQVHRAKAHEGAHLGAYPRVARFVSRALQEEAGYARVDRKSTRLNSSHVKISYAVFCLKKKRRAKV